MSSRLSGGARPKVLQPSVAGSRRCAAWDCCGRGSWNAPTRSSCPRLKRSGSMTRCRSSGSVRLLPSTPQHGWATPPRQSGSNRTSSRPGTPADPAATPSRKPMRPPRLNISTGRAAAWTGFVSSRRPNPSRTTRDQDGVPDPLLGSWRAVAGGGARFPRRLCSRDGGRPAGTSLPRPGPRRTRTFSWKQPPPWRKRAW